MHNHNLYLYVCINRLNVRNKKGYAVENGFRAWLQGEKRPQALDLLFENKNAEIEMSNEKFV